MCYPPVPSMDDCSCGIAAILESRSMGIWSPRSEGAAQDIGAMQARFATTPSSTLPARHSKSLDQLGPEMAPLQPRSSSKTLPRFVRASNDPRSVRFVRFDKTHSLRRFPTDRSRRNCFRNNVAELETRLHQRPYRREEGQGQR